MRSFVSTGGFRSLAGMKLLLPNHCLARSNSIVPVLVPRVVAILGLLFS